MTRLKWLWWKFWAWLTTPRRPEDKQGNPRSKKRRGDPLWYTACLYLMYGVNTATMALLYLYVCYLVGVSQ